MSATDQPAPGILGSTLLATALAREKLRPAPASSGCAAVDGAALEGGFRYGEITSIAGASGMGKTLIAFHAIASHLLIHIKGEVALITTTNSFSPLRLRDVLAFRLKQQSQRTRFQQSGYMYEKVNDTATENVVVEEATSMLARVKVMPVFDLAGVVETIAEVSQTWENVTLARENAKSIRNERQEKFVADSDDDEMLESEEELHYTSQNASQQGAIIEDPQAGPAQIGMIVIDTITNVVSSMMSKSQIQGQALTVSVLRTIHHLTTTHSICTILTNSAVALNASPSNPSNPARRGASFSDSVSIFASTPGKPALGKTFTYLIDTSIFLSQVPRKREDAEIMAAGPAGAGKWDKCGVLEVLRDRCGDREGRWSAFEMVGGIEVRGVGF